ncbi:hypothetical protein JTS96_17780 [Clostridium botulinum]|nr:hypothetical protein [Clostridium botulinum]
MNKLSTIISTIPIAIIATIITIIVTHIREYLKDTKSKGDMQLFYIMI